MAVDLMGGDNVRKVAVYAAINLVVLGSLTAPVVTALPVVIARLVPDGDRTTVLAAVTVAGAVASVIANPLFGWMSDRTRGPFGRRRPWLLGGVVGGLLASILIVVSDSVAMLAVGWVLAQTAYNATLAAVAALFGDQVSERRRASASGVFGAAAFLGTLPPLLLAAIVPDQLGLVVLAMPVAAVIVVGASCVIIADPPVARSADADRALRPGLRLIRIRQHRMFALVWVQRFLVHVSFSLMAAFPLYFVVDRLRLTPEGGSPVVAVTTLAGGAAIVVAALGAGLLAGRRGRYGPYIGAAALGLALAATLRAATGDTTQLWVSAAVAGAALGMFYAVDLALVLRTIPADARGAFLGVFNIAETVPATLGPGLALAVLAVSGSDPLSGGGDNYFALYLSAAAVALLALVPLMFLRPVLTRIVGGRKAAPVTETVSSEP